MAFDPDEYLSQDSKFDPDAYLAEPSGPTTKQKIQGSAPGRVVQGMRDPVDGIAEIVPKWLSLSTSLYGALPNPVSRFFDSEGERVRGINQANEAEYQDARQAVEGKNLTSLVTGENDLGIDWWRIGGNIVSPVNRVLPGGGLALSPAKGVIPALSNTAKLAGRGAVVGAIGGLTQPTKEGDFWEQKGEQLKTGALIGAGANPVLAKTGEIAKKVLGSSVASGKTAAAQNSVRDESVNLARELDMAIPPGQAGGGVVDKTLEGFAGKVSTAQKASTKNQQRVNDLIKQDLGVNELTEESIAGVRKEAGKAYEAVKNVGPLKTDSKFAEDLKKLSGDFSAAADEFPEIASNESVKKIQQALSKDEISSRSAVELIKKLRKDSTVNFKAFSDPEKLELAKAQRAAADVLEALVERNLPKDSTLIQDFQKARQQMAKSYDAEAAFEGGNINPQHYAKLARKDRPLSGNAEKIGRLADSFPKAFQKSGPMGSVLGASPLDWWASTGATAITGSPLAMLGTLARPAVRSAILSKPYQKTVGPSYGPGLGQRMSLGLLSDERALKAALLGGVFGGSQAFAEEAP